MKNFPKKMLIFTLSASLALTPTYAQASALPETTPTQESQQESLAAIELTELEENLETSLKKYLSEHADSLTSLTEIGELTILNSDNYPITVKDCEYIEKYLPNLEKLDVKKAIFSDEAAYLYFQNTENFTYLYTENAFVPEEQTEFETTEAETVESEIIETETTEAETTEAETTESETTEAETTEAETAESETTEAETAEAETTESEATEVETAESETAEAETTESEITESKTAEAETTESKTDGNPLAEEIQQGMTLSSATDALPNNVSAITSNTQSQVTLSLTNASCTADADIYFAVWSHNNGQDDVCWYLADKETDTSFTKVIDIKNHHLDSGKYYVHVYENVKGRNTLLTHTTFEIAGISDAQMTVSALDPSNGIYRIEVNNLSAPSGITSVRIPVWSSKNGQDDISWYEATSTDDTWYVDFPLSDHNYESGKYIAHAYAYDAAGHSKLCTYKNFDVVAPTVNNLSVKLNSDKTKATITLSNAKTSGKVSKVHFPVWGTQNGQNDIVWYKAKQKDGVWTATVDLKNHHENGSFMVHAYVYNTNDQSQLAGYTTFNIPPASAKKVSVINKDDVNGSYQIKIDDLSVPFGVSSVLVPTWTSKNGQDDILWYEAKKENNSWIVTIDSGNHNFETGKYISHIYVYDNYGGSQLLNALNIDVKAADQVQLTTKTNDEQTKLTVTLKNYRSQSQDVRFAVWGEEKGQNDIQWYYAKKSGTTYTYTVDLNKHKEIGKFNVHAYNCSGASPVLIRGISTNIAGITNATVTVDSQDNDYGKFTIKISGASSPAGIAAIKVPVWSKNNGQDDLVYYTPKKKGNDWYLTVDISNHKDDIGDYEAHVYVTDNRGIEQLVGHTIVHMKASTLPAIPKITYNRDSQTATITISNVRKASAVHIPVWGNPNGQNDIQWYTAKKVSKTTWEATVDLSNHKEAGTYQAHIYTEDANGVQTLAANQTFDVPQYYWFSSKDNVYGTCKVSVNVKPKKTLSQIRMAVWTEANGQDDLHWYSAALSGSNYETAIDSKNHNFESGAYNVHIYAYYTDGTNELLAGTKTTITRTARIYQNPSQYYQIQDSISLSGGGYNLSYGYEGLKVAKVIQRLGVNGGNYVGMGGAIYGPKTTAAVKNFQRNHGLLVTGVVDLKTWLAMGFTEYDWYNLGAYVHPMKVNKNSTRSDHIEAMISTAYEYLGDPYVIGASGAPGLGLDCSGLVMQALYSAGIDTSPINPVRHSYPGYEYESANMWASSKFKHVSYAERQRGDLIIYQNSNGVVIHIAIYLGNNQVIESWPNQVVVWPVQNGQRANIKGVLRPFV